MSKKKGSPKKAARSQSPKKIDLGCGKNKKEGFWGVDAIAFDGVDEVVNLAYKFRTLTDVDPVTHKPYTRLPSGFAKWPWKDGSVEEFHASHVMEHFDAMERVHVVNEMHRCLKVGGKATVITPHWASMRAYGDLTHKWPPVCEFWFYYLSKEWRAVNAPHNDFYTCDFDVTWGYAIRDDLAVRNQETQQFALANYKEAAQDTIATFTKR